MLSTCARLTCRPFQNCCIAFVALSVAMARSFSQEDERAIGSMDAAQLDSQLPLIDDSVVTQYIASLGLSIASRTSRGDLDWRFAVVNAPEVNAFALPGGVIYVNRGHRAHDSVASSSAAACTGR